MNENTIWVIFISFFLLIHTTSSVEYEIKISLVNFLSKLTNTKSQSSLVLGWNISSDPCKDSWEGVICNPQNTDVQKLLLNNTNLAGSLDLALLCNVKPLAATLSLLNFETNNIRGGISTDIALCNQLTRIYVDGNKLSGDLPTSLASLNNLKHIDISNNNFSCKLPPDLPRITGLQVLLAQNNKLSGELPKFEFSNFEDFNVSYNNFTGLIPSTHGHIPESSFLGNPGLCGEPLKNDCVSSINGDSNNGNKSKATSKYQFLMCIGYAVVGLALILLIIVIMAKRNGGNEKLNAGNKVVAADVDNMNKSSFALSDYKTGFSKSEISVNGSVVNSALLSTSMIVINNPVVKGFRFEDLLKAPAELLGRGTYGSLYKVVLDNGTNLVVKRIKDWAISTENFKQKMQRLDQIKHPSILPCLAFYSSNQEKLLVYEYQHNGSLFRFLHGTDLSQTFDWVSRLGIAATIAEALVFMHKELGKKEIAHGNLKSSNILLNENMEPCISEYGLLAMNNQESSLLNSFSGTIESDTFKQDIYGFGVILLELLTGKLVRQNGVDLTDWVQSVLREEWTVEVFDRILMSECASEERMLNLLQVAIKCVNRSPEARPNMNQVASIINTIRDEEDRSMVSVECLN